MNDFQKFSLYINKRPSSSVGQSIGLLIRGSSPTSGTNFFNNLDDIVHQIDSYKCVGFNFKTLLEIQNFFDQQFQEIDLESDERTISQVTPIGT
jgi:hypothetical protein